MVYGHYDVQPPEPLDLWKSPPFEPRIAGRSIFARGTTDNKGQHFAHLKAVEAYLKTGTPLPCDLTFVIEGEEEVGSANLAKFLKSHRNELKCDAVVVSDTGMPDADHPALTYALRGIIAFEITVHGPSRDLHSGIFGGAVDNPAMALSQLLGQTARQKWPRRHSRFLRRRRAAFGVRAQTIQTPAHHRPRTPEIARREKIVRRTRFYAHWNSAARGRRLKSTASPAAIRAQAAKPSCRPGRAPKSPAASCRTKDRRASAKSFAIISRKSVRRRCGWKSRPATARKPISFRRPARRRRRRCARCAQAFHREPVLLREGGSIPIVNDFKKVLGADSLLLGLGLPEDNAHSPNEKFDLDCFENGQRMSALLWQELAKDRQHPVAW